MELASDSSLNGDSINQGGLVAQADTSQLVVAGYGHYVDGRGKRIMLSCPPVWWNSHLLAIKLSPNRVLISHYA